MAALDGPRRDVRIPYKFTLADLNLRSYYLILEKEPPREPLPPLATLRDHLRKAVVLANVEVCMVRNWQMWQKDNDRHRAVDAGATLPRTRAPTAANGNGTGAGSSSGYVLDLDDPQPLKTEGPVDAAAEVRRLEDNHQALAPIIELLSHHGDGAKRCSRRRIVSLLRRECEAAGVLLGQCREAFRVASRYDLAELAYTFAAYQPAVLDEELKGSQSPYDPRSHTRSIDQVRKLVAESVTQAEARGPELLVELAVRLVRVANAESSPHSRMEGMMLQAACMCGLSELVEKLLDSRSSEVTETDLIRRLITAWGGYRGPKPMPELQPPAQGRALGWTRPWPQTLDWLDFKCSTARAVLIAHKIIVTVIMRDDRGLTESLQLAAVQRGALAAVAAAAAAGEDAAQLPPPAAAAPPPPEQPLPHEQHPHLRVQFTNGLGPSHSLGRTRTMRLRPRMTRALSLAPARTSLGAVLLNDAKPAELEPQRWVRLKALFPRHAACKPLALAIMHVVLAGKREVQLLRREEAETQRLQPQQRRRQRSRSSDGGGLPPPPAAAEPGFGATSEGVDGEGGAGAGDGDDDELESEDDEELRRQEEAERVRQVKEARGARYHKLHLLAVQAAHLAVHSSSLSTVSDALLCIRAVRAWPAIGLDLLGDLAEYFPQQCGALLEAIPLTEVDLEDNVLPFGLPAGFMTVAVSDKDAAEFGQGGQGGDSTQDAEHFATQEEEDVTIEASLLVQARTWLALLFLFWPSELRSPTSRKLLRVMGCAVAAFLCQGPGSWLVALVFGLALAVLAVLSRLVVALVRILYWGVLRRIWGRGVKHFPLLNDVALKILGRQGSTTAAGLNTSTVGAISTRVAPGSGETPRGAGAAAAARGERAPADGTGGGGGGGAGGEGDSDSEIDLSDLKQHLTRGLWQRFFAHGHNSIIDAAVGWGQGSASISCRKVPILMSYGKQDSSAQLRTASAQPQGARQALQVRQQLDTALLEKLLNAPGLHPSVFGSKVLRALIVFKWNYFTKYFIILQFLLHLTYMGVFLAYAFTIKDMEPVDGRDSGPGAHEPGCQLQAPSRVQTGLLVALAVMTVDFTIQEIRQIRHFGLMFLTHAWDVLDICSVALVIASISLHFSCTSGVSPLTLRGLAAMQIVLLFMRLLYYGMASEKLGAFVRMVLETTYDLMLFFAFLSVVFVGFALAIIISQGPLADEEQTFIKLFTMMYGDFDVTFLSTLDSGALGLDALTRVLASLYMIMVTIILLNLLISVISESYERIRDNERWESLRNKALLVVESETQLYQSFLTWLYSKLTLPSAGGGGGSDGHDQGGESRRYLYVIVPEYARRAQSVADDDDGGSDEEEDDDDGDDEGDDGQWIGRLGEVKRHIATQGRTTLDGVRKELAKIHELLDKQQQQQAPGGGGGVAAAAAGPAPAPTAPEAPVAAAAGGGGAAEALASEPAAPLTQLDPRIAQLIAAELSSLVGQEITRLREELLAEVGRTAVVAMAPEPHASGPHARLEPLPRSALPTARTTGGSVASAGSDAGGTQVQGVASELGGESH